MKIVVIEPIGVSFETIQAAFPEDRVIEYDSRTWSDERLIKQIKDAEIIALTNRPLSASVIHAASHLKYIGVAFSGIDHIDKEAALARGISIVNAAGYADTAVAELVFGLMIVLARDLCANNVKIRKNGITNTGIELKGKTLGIVGFGGIGKEVTRLARAFQMNTLIYDRKSAIALEDVFSQSDFISLHVPLTNETRGMIDRNLLSKMKKSAFLINCARGPIVVSEDLKYFLDNQLIAGAALDVFDIEPPLPSDFSLFQAPNLIATPHIGFNTREALRAKGLLTVHNIKAFLDGVRLTNQ